MNDQAIDAGVADDLAPFGDWVRHRRRTLDLTQAALARCVGCALDTIKKIETGARRPSMQMAARLADCLRVPPEQTEAFVRIARGELRAGEQLQADGAGAALGSGIQSGGVKAGDLVLDKRRTNLPAQLTSFIGRENEIAELKARVKEARLLTLTGAGGVGKTRLALYVAARMEGDFPDGVWLVELAALSNPALVTQQAAEALGVKEEAGAPLLDALIEALRGQELLLILDNCEHVIEACAALTHALLSACPQLRILATSRESLNVPGEHVFAVVPLDLPHAAIASLIEGVLSYSAVRLFVERARLVELRFTLNDANVLPIVQICTRLDGVALAIELAAARVRHLSVSDIAARLDSRLDLLVGARTTAPRQQTLRALIEWSYNLCSDDERALFRRLSVFAGGWTLDALDALDAPADAAVSTSSVSQLSSLVSKSLVVTDTTDEHTRYQMLETIREYAQERLIAAGEAAGARQHHLAYFVHMADDAMGRLWGPQALPTLQQLDRESDNLRAALRFAIESGDVARAVGLAGALGDYWMARGHSDEAEHCYAEVLQLRIEDAPVLARARLFSSAGSIAWMRSDPTRAKDLHRRALALYQQANDAHGVALSLNNLAVQCADLGDAELAQRLYDEALARARSTNDTQVMAMAHHNLSNLQRSRNEPDEAVRHCHEALLLARQGGDKRHIASTEYNLSDLLLLRGDFSRAEELLAQALDGGRECGDRWLIQLLICAHGHLRTAQGRWADARASYAEGLQMGRKTASVIALRGAFTGFAAVEASSGDAVRATRLLGYAEGFLARYPGETRLFGDYPFADAIVARLRQGLGDERFESEWAEGRRMAEAQAIALTLVDG